MNPLTHHDIEELLGAYALDAVDESEANEIEIHLRDCIRCRSIVAEFRDTASHLASGHGPAPVAVWDAIIGDLDAGEHRGFNLASIIPLRRRWPIRAIVGTAAAAVIAISGLTVQAISQGNRLREMEATIQDRGILSAALAAMASPDARQAELRTADGVVFAHVVVTLDGTGFLRRESLNPLPGNRTYQLWAVMGTGLISAGVLGPNPDVVPFQMAGEIIGFAVTEEIAGGVVTSQNQPIATGLIVNA